MIWLLFVEYLVVVELCLLIINTRALKACHKAYVFLTPSCISADSYYYYSYRQLRRVSKAPPDVLFKALHRSLLYFT